MYLAYLDPASGSMLAAAVVAGFAGAAVAVKVWWRRIFGRFRRQPAPATAGQTPAGQASAESPDPAPADSGQTDVASSPVNRDQDR